MEYTIRAFIGFIAVSTIVTLCVFIYSGDEQSTKIFHESSSYDWSIDQLATTGNEDLKRNKSQANGISKLFATRRPFGLVHRKNTIDIGNSRPAGVNHVARYHAVNRLTRYQLSNVQATTNVQLFKDTVLSRANPEKILFLASVDYAYVTLALNLYETSFAPLKIENYLFVGSDIKVCQFLDKYQIVCIQYFEDAEGETSSDWGSVSFRRKTHYKTKIILETLKLGITIVIVDVDIVFFKNPLPYLVCETCDIQIQNDIVEGNSGFYMARPTQAAINLHEKALAIGGRTGRLSNQKALSRTMEWMARQRMIKQRTLSNRLFPCGSQYFEENHIMFEGDGNCHGCVLAHNNWIISQAAKIYRFKETGLWLVDIDGYYSSTSRKYIVFENPLDFGAGKDNMTTLQHETTALKTALLIGALTNRTVILPSFHCYGCLYKACKNVNKHCALNTFYKIVNFDVQFGSDYREHVFLSHPKVPESVKTNTSPVILIETISSRERSILSSDARNSIGKIFTPSNIQTGPTTAELLNWLLSYRSYSILRFHSLYGAFSSLHLNELVTQKLIKAFTKSEYRQYDIAN